jgi:hypothetical protein
MTNASMTGSTIGRAIKPRIISTIQKTAPTTSRGSKTIGTKTSQTTLNIQKVILISTAANTSAIKIVTQNIAPITFILQIIYFVGITRFFIMSTIILLARHSLSETTAGR